MRAVISQWCAALRNAGFDAVAIIEVAPGAEDAAVIDLAVREGRMLITEDKDFGRFVYADERHTAGVMLLRFPATARANIASTVVELIGRRGDRLEGRFVVVQPGRRRIGGIP